MKPANWNKMTAAEKHDDATRLLSSIRGKLILGQALAKAVAVMKTETYPEHSNIEDMEELGETLFAPFFTMYSPEGEAQMRAAVAKLQVVKD
jgi:hypothetical protein